MKREEFFVDVSPDMEIYNILQVLGYSIDTALAEFVDNSVQAFLDNKDKLQEKPEIRIHVSEANNTISICDNAGGITRETMQFALTPAGITIAGGAHPKNSLSVYGVGMKTASIWFTNHWSLETSPIGKDDKFIFDFNLSTLLEQGTKTGTVIVEDENIDKTYTKITLHNIIRKFSKEDFENKIAPYILETFQKFLNEINILFFYNGEQLTANAKFLELSEPKTLVYMPVNKDGVHEHKCLVKWRIDIKVDFKGVPVTGFFLIRDIGSYEQAGIRLLRNNRVIEGTSVYPNYPSALVKTKNKFSAQRLYGEFHLDGFDVDFMKTRFSDDLDELYQAISDEVKSGFNVNLIWQADHFRARQQEKVLLEKLMETRIFANIEEKVSDLKYPKWTEPSKVTEDDNSPTSGGESVGQTGFNFDSGNTAGANDNTSENGNSNDGLSETKNDTLLNSSSESTGSSSPVKITKITRNSDPNKIVFSERAANLIIELDSDKLIDIANSLQTVVWTRHPNLITIGVWSFWETICKQMGADDNKAIDHFLNPKIDSWYSKKDARRKPMKDAIEEIRKKGNCEKHSLHNYNKDASNLNPWMKELDPVLIKCLEVLIAKKNTQKVS